MDKKVMQALICMVFVIVLAGLTKDVAISFSVEADVASKLALDELEKRAENLRQKVMTSVYEIEGDNFYKWLVKRTDELEEQFPSARMSLIVYGEVDGLARLEMEYGFSYLYLNCGDRIYEFRSRVLCEEPWEECVQELLYEDGVTLEGIDLPKDIFAHEVKFPSEAGVSTWFYYDFIDYLLGDGEILSCKQIEGGISLQILEQYKEEYVTEDIEIREVVALPKYETEEELRDYFLKLYPDMTYYEVNALDEEEATEWEERFYRIEEDANIYGYFTRYGKQYLVQCRREKGASYDNIVAAIFWKSDYHYNQRDCMWEKTEEGIEWSNFNKRIFMTDRDIGVGERFYFEIKPPEDAKSMDMEIGYMEYGEDLEVSVYREGEKEPFQRFETSSVHFDWHPVSFSDNNADGYLDFEMLYYHGTKDGTYSYYIWSPSQQKFVDMPEELADCDGFWAEEETRRFYQGKDGLTYGERELYIYQLENEMDYHLIGYAEYTCFYDAEKEEYLVVRINEDSTEEVLIDCIADTALGKEHLMWAFCYDKIIDELVIEDKTFNTKFKLYMTQEALYGDDGIIEGGYENYLYVVAEDLYLVERLEWDGYSAYSSMAWTTDKNGEEKLVIEFQDGSERECSIEELRGIDYEFSRFGSMTSRQEYFLEKYPNMTELYIYPKEDEIIADTYFYKCYEDDVCYVHYEGKDISLPQTKESEAIVKDLQKGAGYAEQESYIWQRNDEEVFWQDYVKNRLYLEEDIGTGEVFVFKTRLWSWDALGIEIYRKGEKEPFQKLEIECEETFKNQIHMEDYNVDGYLDFAVEYAEDGCGYYLWNDVEGVFVENIGEIDAIMR